MSTSEPTALLGTPPLAGSGDLVVPAIAIHDVGLGRSRFLMFAVVSIGLFMASLDSTVVATALPTLQHSLHASVNWAGWTITAYMLGQTVAMPIAGRFSDLIGRKRLFMGCVVLFTLTSLACGLSTSIYMLVPLRFVQALGGGAFMPSATGIVSDHFGAGRDRAIGMFNSIFPLGMLLGPIVGGIIITYWSWRGVFFINVPIGVLLFVAASRVIPRSKGAPGELPDLLGVLQLCLIILFTMYSITVLGGGQTAVWSPKFLIPAACAWIAIALFVRRVKRLTMPIIPMKLLLGSGFRTLNLLNFTWGICAVGVSLLVPLYAQDRYGLTPLRAGTVLTARAIGMLVFSVAAAMTIRRTGYKIPVLVSVLLQASGLLLLTLRPVGLPVYDWLAVGAAIMGLGIGIGGPSLSNAGLSMAPEHASAVSGLRGMFRQAGGIICISVVTTVVARSAHHGSAFAASLTVIAGLSLLIIPLIFAIPARRGSW